MSSSRFIAPSVGQVVTYKRLGQSCKAKMIARIPSKLSLEEVAKLSIPVKKMLDGVHSKPPKFLPLFDPKKKCSKISYLLQSVKDDGRPGNSLYLWTP